MSECLVSRMLFLLLWNGKKYNEMWISRRPDFWKFLCTNCELQNASEKDSGALM